MQTPTRKPQRRSREELRLEQIAIWGDAAYNTRHTTAPPPKTDTAPSCAEQIDVEYLEEAVIAEGMQLPPTPRGSFSMCHSRSAEWFRRSGSYAAITRASFRGRQSVRLEERKGGRDWIDVIRSRRGAGRKEGFEEDLLIHRRDSAAVRERDEDNFRKGMAKLPERDDDTGGHLHLRSARASMTMLGRYNRTRSCQLPPRARDMLLADTSLKTRS